MEMHFIQAVWIKSQELQTYLHDRATDCGFKRERQHFAHLTSLGAVSPKILTQSNGLIVSGKKKTKQLVNLKIFLFFPVLWE